MVTGWVWGGKSFSKPKPLKYFIYQTQLNHPKPFLFIFEKLRRCLHLSYHTPDQMSQVEIGT
jgi:hypothetical protein